MVDAKELAVVFFYNQIKQIASQFFSNFGLGLDIDVVLAAIGYWKRNTWWGKGLLYGAVASLGASGGLSLAGLFRTTEATSTSTTGLTPGASKLVYKYAV